MSAPDPRPDPGDALADRRRRGDLAPIAADRHALRRLPRTSIDRVAMGLALVVISAPVYWLGLIVLYLFARDIGKFPLLPGTGYRRRRRSGAGRGADHALVRAGRRVRRGLRPAAARDLLEALQEDYIRTARAKGLSRAPRDLQPRARAPHPDRDPARRGHRRAARGRAADRAVFNVPGIGRLLLNAIHRADLPAIQGPCSSAVLRRVMSLIVDLLYALIDPG